MQQGARASSLATTDVVNPDTTIATKSSALSAIGLWLVARGYAFTTVSPSTHRRVNARSANEEATDLRDIFGWSRPFRESLLPAEIIDALDSGNLLDRCGARLKSRVRYSTCGGCLYAHSAFPTTDADCVFFGPDTYRFVALIERELAMRPLLESSCIVDIGCGSGAGGIAAAMTVDTSRVILADINDLALQFAAANATLAELDDVRCVESDVFSRIDEKADLILSNPPYMMDAAARVYRDGGGEFGAALSLRILRESLDHLAPNGRLILYTGTAVVDGVDVFKNAADVMLRGWRYHYEEIDPDVFGEELDEPAYSEVERIAAVGLIVYSKDDTPKDEK